MSTNYPTICPHCGAPLGSMEACFQVLAGIQTKEQADPDLGKVNRLTTDAHALQHVEELNDKDICFHLARLCWILEYDGSAAIGNGPTWLQQSLDDTETDMILAPPKPMQRGKLTVAGIFPAIPADEHAIIIKKWAQSVWQAWESHHAWARRWVEENKPD